MNTSRTKTQNNTESQNPCNPYYFNPGENPGMILVSPQLYGNNYHSCHRAMKRVLLLKNKWKFVDGSIEASTKTNSLYEAWERCNVMVIIDHSFNIKPNCTKRHIH